MVASSNVCNAHYQTPICGKYPYTISPEGLHGEEGVE